jgi:hypothetical protein
MSIVHLRMVVAVVLERRRAREEGLKCVDVVVVERVLTEAVVVVVVVVV